MLKIKKILAINIFHEILSCFRKSIKFFPEYAIAYTPEFLAMSATIIPEIHAIDNKAYYQLYPSAIVIDSKTARIFVFKRRTEHNPYRLWIGGTIQYEDFCSPDYKVSTSMDIILRGYMKIVPKYFTCNFLGFLYTKRDKSHNRFGIIYSVNVASAKLKENQWATGTWMTIADIKKIYKQIDPWSKVLFDYIYEHPNIRQKLKLYQKSQYKKH